MTGIEALQALKDGRQVRCTRWTPDCWIKARYSPDEGIFVVWAYGTPIFKNDVYEDKSWILNDLLCDTDWEVKE
jgi:hypothetical protein